jgi:hypothetical protein
MKYMIPILLGCTAVNAWTWYRNENIVERKVNAAVSKAAESCAADVIREEKATASSCEEYGAFIGRETRWIRGHGCVVKP